MDERRYSSLPLLFRASFLERLADRRYFDMVNQIIDQTGMSLDQYRNKTMLDFLSDMYDIMLKNYRCEYVFKNIITNKIFLSRHSPERSSVLSEFRSGKARADLVILNGTSTVYEIKTDLDSVAKLPSQISAYRNIFDKINVVTTEGMLGNVLKYSGEGTGVIVVGRRNSLKVVREAVSRVDVLSPAHMFDCLRKPEYVAVIREVFGKVPEVPNTQIYKECKKIFVQIPPSVAHSHMVAALKRRSRYSRIAALVESVPPCLKHACLNVAGSPDLACKIWEGLAWPVVFEGESHVFSVSAREAIRPFSVA